MTLAPAAQSASGGAAIDLGTLLLLSAAGDHAAFRRLHDSTAPLLFAQALRITGDSAAAIEATQASLLTVWRGQPRFDPSHDAPLGWLLALLRGRATEIARRRLRDAVGVDLAHRGTALAEDFERLARDPVAAAFHAGFAMLDHEHRQILTLAFLDGLSHAELAQRLRMPIGTVRVVVRAALDRLRHALGTAA
jgi:RNA polymerase sigma-70 factor (ECF subfamily)